MMLPWLGVVLFLGGALALVTRDVTAAGHRVAAIGGYRSALCVEPVAMTASAAAFAFAVAIVDAQWESRPGFVVAVLLTLPTLVTLAVIDVDVHRLPNRLTLTTALLVAVGLTFAGFVDGMTFAGGQGSTAGTLLSEGGLGSLLDGFDVDAARRAGLGALALGAFYLALAFLSGGSGMGLGDVKLAPSLGALMAWGGWGTWLNGAFAAFVLGGLWGLVLMARGMGRNARMPFGPFMIVGTLAALWAA